MGLHRVRWLGLDSLLWHMPHLGGCCQGDAGKGGSSTACRQGKCQQRTTGVHPGSKAAWIAGPASDVVSDLADTGDKTFILSCWC